VRNQDSNLAWEAFRHYDDVAGRRFDEALAAMPLSALQRRELRFWHRQSMEALRLYAARALPAALSNIDGAQEEADELVARAGASWQRAASAAAEPPAEAAAPAAVVPEAAPSTVRLTSAADEQPDALEIRRRALAARLAAGS
jgi:hypothetical protein